MKKVEKVDFYKGQIVTICNPLPHNKLIKGKKLKIYRSISDERIAASFVLRKDLIKYSSKMFTFYKSELCK